MRHPGYRKFLVTYVVAMMADNIEHVISYWVIFQKFHSPALGGFAVVSHWLPYLLFSVPVGALNDRFDSRRLIQIGMLLFIVASAGWGYFFVTDSLEMWHAMVLLVIHGCAGVLWQPSSQILLHDIVNPTELQSAVRLLASGRYLGVLFGPAVGGVLLLQAGPAHGILLNTVFYLPALLWLWKAPYGAKFRAAAAAVPRRAVRGFADVVQTLRDISGFAPIAAMTTLAGAASFFIGGSYQAQMPNFAHDLGHGDPGTAYSMLLAADAAGALLAGVLLESASLLKPNPRTALVLCIVWCVSLTGFALAGNYVLALVMLFLAGFFELSFSSMAQAIVQIDAPAAIRGRVIGLFNMAALGLRTFSGIMIGVIGGLVGVHYSLAGSALLMLAVVLWLLVRHRANAARATP